MPKPFPRVAVVTGASAGVGRATAVALAEAGADVGLLARGTDGLEGARKDVERAGRRALVLPADVADPDAVDAAADRVEHELGPIDLWVNNAMTTVFGRIEHVQPEEIRRATEVTYLGQVHGTLAALRHMVPRDEGHIINVGSALAYRGIPLQAPYCGAKFAVRGFSESVRTELLHDGSHVRLSMVHLPAVNTPQFAWCRTKLGRSPQPVPPIYEPEIPAAAIVRVARTGRARTIVGSWNWALVQVNKLIPGVVDQYAAATCVEAQLTDDDVPPDRPDDLYEPADGPGGGDWNAHGTFGARSRGVLDPTFLRSLPATLVAVCRAVARDLGTLADGIGRPH